MINKKIKTIYPVSLSEVKTHLRIDASTTDDDTYLTNAIIKSATKYCENFIDKDIALTSNTLTFEDFYGSYIRVDEGNLVSLDYIITDSSTLITDYELYTYDDHFEVEFESTVDCEPLVLKFKTGYDPSIYECPEEIQQAIFIKCADLFDMERSSYSFSNSKKVDIAERILMNYKSIRW